MADVKISQLTALNGADAVAGDLLTVVDISDTTMSASGTNKKMTLVQFQAAPVSAGTANGVTYLNGSKVLTSGSALTFDGSNLGLGVTPSAWGSSLKVIQVNARGAFFANSTNTFVANNYYDDGSSYRYIATAAATDYYQSSGAHIWRTAASGTSGNVIAFTQAMTLDASGRLGVGTTSPVAKIQGTNDAAPASSGNLVSGLLASGSDGGLGIGFGASNASDFTWIQSAFTNNAGVSAASLRFYMGATERMRLDSAGNLIQSAPATPPTLATDGQMVFNLTSDTNLRVSVRGADGVTRTANITLA